MKYMESVLRIGDKVRITSENLHPRTPTSGTYTGPRYGMCAVLLDGTQTTLVFPRRELDVQS
jgi:hypothetical protein